MRKFVGVLEISFSYWEGAGGRIISAGVTLGLSTSDKYTFVNNADWSEGDYGSVVERGVRDGLVESDYDPDLGISIVLKSIEYDSVGSSENSFYVAAKAAIKARDTLKHNMS